MTLTTLFKTTVRFFYHLTVGLTVLLIRAGLLYVISFLTLAAWIVTVGVVTYKTYTATDHHLGWSVGACVLTSALCGGVIVAVHRVVKDWLGLTTLSLSQLVCLLFLRRRPPPPPPPSQQGAEGDDGRRGAGGAQGSEERVHVKVTRTRKVIVSGSSSAEKRTPDSWR